MPLSPMWLPLFLCPLRAAILLVFEAEVKIFESGSCVPRLGCKFNFRGVQGPTIHLESKIASQVFLGFPNWGKLRHQGRRNRGKNSPISTYAVLLLLMLYLTAYCYQADKPT
ncbi:hypothetical protein BJ166DRAFT_614232 [Pestalotiopsis sp. NC0098]|nr:hypothetical protein BJ166DRAFT_614232 [Pestalotiopsis sp. NC0098]